MIVGINDAFITSIAHCNDYTISGDVFDDTIDFINATSQHIIISSNNSIKLFPAPLPYDVATDLDYQCEVIDKKCDDYCCQLLWEDPHTILMCFQCSIKKIDLRTSEFVRTWDSFNYAPLTCCSSDNLYTFVTGSYTGVLWDQRQSVAIQTYTVEHGITLYNKGIDSLEFDNAHMYTATCNGLYELDFTGKNSFSDEGTGSESAEELD
nr:PREDICTED: uncharacterized protein LOC105679238 [Linepithema humile]